jgi:iron(III) transport system ATP-binding protein
MDEPLANLDMHLRESMLDELRNFRSASGATVLYITHDQAEAMSISDRIGVMFNGKLVQVATPQELYEKPSSSQVAGFIGVSTLLPVQIISEHNGIIDGFSKPIAVNFGRKLKLGDKALLCIRPEDVVIGQGDLQGTVKRSVYLGGRYIVDVECEHSGPCIKAYCEQNLKIGSLLSFDVGRSWVMPQKNIQ